MSAQKEHTKSKRALSGSSVSKQVSQDLAKIKVFVPTYMISEWTQEYFPGQGDGLWILLFKHLVFQPEWT
jgi:hypothetical protein